MKQTTKNANTSSNEVNSNENLRIRSNSMIKLEPLTDEQLSERERRQMRRIIAEEKAHLLNPKF